MLEFSSIMDHTFSDLANMQSHVEICTTPSIDSLFIYTRDNTPSYPYIHIGEIYDGYPRFDSFDDCDDRIY